MSLPPHEVGRRLDQQAHDIEDAYDLITELRVETAAGFARVNERLDGVDGRLDSVDNRLDSHGQLLERILHLLDNPGT